jgi:hypothetical protein
MSIMKTMISIYYLILICISSNIQSSIISSLTRIKFKLRIFVRPRKTPFTPKDKK